MNAHGRGQLRGFTYLRKGLNPATKMVADKMFEAGKIILISVEGIKYYCEPSYI